MLDNAARSEVVALDLLRFTVDNNGAFKRVGVADGVGEADIDFFCIAVFKVVDGDTASHVSGGTVDFRGIFAREGAAADRDARAVIVDDELAPGETGVGFEAALIPIPRGIKMELGVARERFLFDKSADEFFEFFLGGVLETGDDGGNLPIFAVVSECNLSLAVERMLREDELIKTASKNDFAREEFRGFVGGVANHNSLVTGTASIDALSNLGALLNDVDGNFEIIAGNTVDDSRNINILCTRSNFAGDEDLAMPAADLNRDARIRILLEIGVEYGIRNLVAELVGVFRRDAFGGAISNHISSSCL